MSGPADVTVAGFHSGLDRRLMSEMYSEITSRPNVDSGPGAGDGRRSSIKYGLNVHKYAKI